MKKNSSAVKLLLVALLGWLSAVGAAETKKEILEQIAKEIGREVEGQAELPLFHHLTDVLNDLTEAQSRTTHKKLMLVNRLHIVDSSEVNAFVTSFGTPHERLRSFHLWA
jgi:hypothetical protein